MTRVERLSALLRAMEVTWSTGEENKSAVEEIVRKIQKRAEEHKKMKKRAEEFLGIRSKSKNAVKRKTHGIEKNRKSKRVRLSDDDEINAA